jgi:putative sterol carrier protein
MKEYTVSEIFEKMPSAFLPEQANGLSAVVQFLIGGDGGGDWVVRVANKRCDVSPGKTPTAQVTISADASLLPDLLTGRQNGMTAFMQGKLRIQGDVLLAQRLLGLFALPKTG